AAPLAVLDPVRGRPAGPRGARKEEKRGDPSRHDWMQVTRALEEGALSLLTGCLRFAKTETHLRRNFVFFGRKPQCHTDKILPIFFRISCVALRIRGSTCYHGCCAGGLTGPTARSRFGMGDTRQGAVPVERLVPGFVAGLEPGRGALSR